MFFLEGIGMLFSIMIASRQDEKEGEVSGWKLFLILGFATNFYLGLLFLIGYFLEKYTEIGFADFIIVYSIYVFFKPFEATLLGNKIPYTAIFISSVVLSSVIYYYATKSKIANIKRWRLRFVPFLMVGFGITFLIKIIAGIT